MGHDANGEWDGVCVCGKREADGIKCRFGATHQPLNPFRTLSATASQAAPAASELWLTQTTKLWGSIGTKGTE